MEEAHRVTMEALKADAVEKVKALKADFAKEEADYKVLMRKLMSDKDFKTEKELLQLEREVQEMTEVARAIKRVCDIDDKVKGNEEKPTADKEGALERPT